MKRRLLTVERLSWFICGVYDMYYRDPKHRDN